MTPTNDSNDSAALSPSRSFDVRYLVSGMESVVLYLPDELAAPIGNVVAHWGNFEVLLDSSLEALLAAEPTSGVATPRNWRKRKLKERVELFRKVSSSWVNTDRSSAAQEVNRILDLAESLQRKRNLVVHGSYGYTVAPMSSTVQNCWAFNQSTGEKMVLDESTLKDIYHSLSHLTARLVAVLKPFMSFEELPFRVISDGPLIDLYAKYQKPADVERADGH